MVAIPGNDIPVTTPVASGRRAWKITAIRLLLGFLSFAAVSVIIYPGPREVNEGRDFHSPEIKPPARAASPTNRPMILSPL
jgi:hypothetical protein